MVTMPGWASFPAALASWVKRASYSLRSLSSAEMKMVLMASDRSSSGSFALYTMPIAPRPSSPRMRKRPSWVIFFAAMARALARHRVPQAAQQSALVGRREGVPDGRGPAGLEIDVDPERGISLPSHFDRVQPRLETQLAHRRALAAQYAVDEDIAVRADVERDRRRLIGEDRAADAVARRRRRGDESDHCGRAHRGEYLAAADRGRRVGRQKLVRAHVGVGEHPRRAQAGRARRRRFREGVAEGARNEKTGGAREVGDGRRGPDRVSDQALVAGGVRREPDGAVIDGDRER